MSDTQYQPGDPSDPQRNIETTGPESATGSGNASADPEHDDLAGRQLGEFQLIRRLGKGGMANVYLAQQTALNRNVAIKVMKQALVSDATYLDRFKTEAMAAANLNHINIVQVYTIGEADNYHFIAQEYVQGKNLKEFISRKGPPELTVALHLMRQIASALQKAGEAGIVHRDIKPENILISRKGVVKIADFGLAQLTLGGERLNLTQEGVTMGTPLYMSPEQVQGNKVDHRSDIYSLGVTCYHMFAGRPPFRGETAIAIAMKQVNSQPTPLDKRRPDLPPAVCRMVHKMMAKKPADRFQSAGEIFNEIRKIIAAEQGGVGDVSLSNFESTTEPMPKTAAWKLPALWQPKRFVLLAVLFVLLGGAIGWTTRPRLPEPKRLDATERSTSREQFAEAMLLGNNEDAWLAVRENFPQSPERWTAEQRLAILYLNQGRFDQANQLFDSFIAQAATGDKFDLAPIGNAGKAVIAAMQGDHVLSDRLLQQHLKRLSKSLDGPMKPLVRDTIVVNSANLDRPNVTVEMMFPELVEEP